MKHTKRGGVTFSEEEIKEMAERAKTLMADPKLALEHYKTKQWVWFQMLEKIIENPPDTRSGLDKARWAMKQYNDLAAVLFYEVDKQEKPSPDAGRVPPEVDGPPRSGGGRTIKFAPPAKRDPKKTRR